MVIPTCNRREILKRCLEALAKQTCRDFEIIVVDDCSTDKTVNMLEDFHWSHPGVSLRWLRNDVHAGANVSRNRGIQAAKAPIIAFLDSDCIAEPDWLEKLLAGFTDDSVAAVTGLVTEPPAENIYELALAGTCRVHGRGNAPRLVGGNLAVRRKRLLECGFDEDAQWRSAVREGTVASPVCDEESLFLMLRARGHRMRVARDAVVVHEHRYDRASFFRHASAGGKAAAFLVHKYFLPPRIDVLPLLMAYLTLPMMWLSGPARWTPLAFFGAMIAAILYNETVRKEKSSLTAVTVLPILFVYYHFRAFSYALESIRLRLGYSRVKRFRLKGLK
mgnify:CR=1 FL=1